MKTTSCSGLPVKGQSPEVFSEGAQSTDNRCLDHSPHKKITNKGFSGRDYFLVVVYNVQIL